MGNASVRTFIKDSPSLHDEDKRYHVNELDMGRTLPLRHEECARVPAATASIAMGLIIGSAGLALAITATDVTGLGIRIALVAMGAMFSCLGVSVFLEGLEALLDKVEITIDGNGVRASARGLIRTRRWQATLDAYFGVLQEKVDWRSGDRQGPAHTMYRVTLKHVSDTDRDVLLYESPACAQHNQVTEDFARLLGRPALVTDEMGNFQLTAWLAHRSLGAC